jgi:hypothetical protein
MQKVALILVPLFLISAAYGQNANHTPQQNSPKGQNQTGAPSTASVAAQIRKNLESAGFKNIKLMPSSFLVRAEDKDGNPVMMVINPDSVTAVSEIDNSRTTGQSQGGASSSGAAGKPDNSGQQSKEGSQR